MTAPLVRQQLLCLMMWVGVKTLSYQISTSFLRLPRLKQPLSFRKDISEASLVSTSFLFILSLFLRNAGIKNEYSKKWQNRCDNRKRNWVILLYKEVMVVGLWWWWAWWWCNDTVVGSVVVRYSHSRAQYINMMFFYLLYLWIKLFEWQTIIIKVRINVQNI